jgi:hypothetical protein
MTVYKKISFNQKYQKYSRFSLEISEIKAVI